MKNNPQLGIIIALIGVTTFVVSDVCAKWLSQTYSVYQIIFFIGLFATISLLFLSRFMKGSIKQAFNPHYRKLLTLRTVCVTIIGYVNVYAFSKIPLADAYAILFTGPIIASILSTIFLKDKIHSKEWLYIIGGFIGVLIAFPPGFSTISLGHLSALFGALIVATMNNVARKMGDIDPPLTVCLIPLLGSLIVSFIVLFTINGAYTPIHTPLDWGLYIAGGIGLSLGFTLLAKAYSIARVAIISPMGYTQMIWALLLGWLLFKDTANVNMLIGSCIIIICGIFISHFHSKQPHVSDIQH